MFQLTSPAAAEAAADAYVSISRAILALDPELTSADRNLLHEARSVLSRAVAHAAEIRRARRD